jgi:trk system potassium uptake protein TrkA
LSQIVIESGYKQFYIDEIINPEEVSSQSIVKTIETPGAREVADFAHGKILLRSFDIPKTSPLCGMRIEELREEDFPWPFLIIALIRKRSISFPKGDATIEAGDRIYVLLPAPSSGEFLSFVDPNVRRPKKVIVYGASHIGERVAVSLSEHIRDISLLEEDTRLAEEVAGRLKATRVLNGSGAEADTLHECGIEAADVFIAASNHDHSNVVSAVLAKKMGAKEAIIITQQPDYMAIIDALDIDVIINPRFLAVDQILRLVRGKGVSAVIKLMERNAEALELVPEAGSPVTLTPIKDIKFPKKSIVGAVCRGSEVILAKGDTQIKAGEQVIVFCQQSAVKKLQELFTHKK